MSDRFAVTRAARRFTAGAVAVLTIHQGALWLLHRAAIAPWPAYALELTAPFGVPRVLSAAFWGGVWWMALGPVVERATGWRHWARAALLGAVPPTAVGALLAVTVGTVARGTTAPFVLVGAALGVNALWGLGAAAVRRRMGSPSRDDARRDDARRDHGAATR